MAAKSTVLVWHGLICVAGGWYRGAVPTVGPQHFLTGPWLEYDSTDDESLYGTAATVAAREAPLWPITVGPTMSLPALTLYWNELNTEVSPLGKVTNLNRGKPESPPPTPSYRATTRRSERAAPVLFV